MCLLCCLTSRFPTAFRSLWFIVVTQTQWAPGVLPEPSALQQRRNTSASQASPRGSQTCRHMDLTKRWPLSELWTGKDFFFCALRYALTHDPTDDVCKAVVPVCLRHSRDRIYVWTCSGGVYEGGGGTGLENRCRLCTMEDK